MSDGLITVTRAAASSTASGMPSRRRQISATASALASSSTKPGCTARARSANSCTASLAITASNGEARGGSSRDESGHTCSPATPSASRLVARIRTPGHSRSNPSVRRPTAERRCSQLSNTRTSSRVRNASSTLSSRVMPGRGTTPNVVATTRASSSASLAAASSHSHAPSGKRRSTSSATWMAMRLFPTPPTPVTVTRRDAEQRVGDGFALDRAPDERRELARQVAGHRVERTERRELAP